MRVSYKGITQDFQSCDRGSIPLTRFCFLHNGEQHEQLFYGPLEDFLPASDCFDRTLGLHLPERCYSRHLHRTLGSYSSSTWSDLPLGWS